MRMNLQQDEQNEPCVQLGNRVALAERELSAFTGAVNRLFGTEHAQQSAKDWAEELESVLWPLQEAIPDWRQLTIAAAARLARRIHSKNQRAKEKRRTS